MEDNQWHLDKRVPIALILTILMQTGAMIAWGASLNQRVAHLEKEIAERSDYAERITRQETLMEGLLKAFNRVEDKVDRLLDESR